MKGVSETMADQQQPQLIMINKHLSRLPEVALPEPFTVGTYAAGDEQAWEAIIGESFQAAFSFAESMMKDSAFRPERVILLKDGDRPVATASAWFKEAYGDETGYLHMVGVVNGYAGQGLGLQVSLAALLQMREEGRRKAVLHTDDFRIPAIKTYLRLGFVPKLEHDSHFHRWEQIAEKLGNPELKEIISSG